MAAVDGLTPSVNDLRTTYGGAFAFRRAERVAASTEPTPASEVASAVKSWREEAAKSADERRSADEAREREADIGQTVDDVNERLARDSRSLRFRVYERTGELQVQVLDGSREKVIRSIPTDEMLKLSERMRELSGVGVMVDVRR